MKRGVHQHLKGTYKETVLGVTFRFSSSSRFRKGIIVNYDRA